jgi:hypothetical protein
MQPNRDRDFDPNRDTVNDGQDADRTVDNPGDAEGAERDNSERPA